MDNISDLDKLTIQTRRREFEDGMFDFIMAGTFVLLALVNWLVFSFTATRWLVTALLWNRELTIIALLIMIVLFFLFIIGARKLIDRIRHKTLWRNSGVVKPLQWQLHWKITFSAVLIFIILLITSLNLANQRTIETVVALRVIVAATGIATGITYFGLGHEIKLPRYRWVGIAGLLLSSALIFLPLSFPATWLGFGLIWVIILCVSGSRGLHQSFANAKGSRNG
jgi:hypothetical protein